MLGLKLIVFTLIISSGVLGRDTRRGNTRYRQVEDEYKYNHPPAPENYEAIPVAVVYEDQSNRDDKAIKNNATQENFIEEVSNKTPKSETAVKKEPNVNEVLNKNLNNVQQEQPKPTTFRPPYIQKEQQIPVAVVYEPETINYQKPSQNVNRVTNNRRKIQRPAPEKHTDDDDNGSSRVQVNGHIGTGSIPVANNRNNFDKRRKTPKPVLEKETVVDDSTATILTLERTYNVKNAGYSSSVVPSDQPQELYVKEKPATKDVETTVDHKLQENKNTPPSITADKPSLVEIPTKPEDNRSTSEQQDVDPQAETSETFKKMENAQQFSKRGNSTRVREVIPIVQSENIVFSHSGNFKYSYEGGDGTRAFEQGELKKFDDESAGEAVSGGFSYTAKDGNEYSLSYTADENGYRPVGAHLPTPPPIPPAIARALAFLATKTTPEPITESIAEYDQ